MALTAAGSAAVLATYLADAHTTTAPGINITGGTLAVALVGGLSAIVVALVPELFKILHGRGERELEPVTVDTLETLEERLTARAEARAASIRSLALGASREVRALREVLETRDTQLRERETTTADRVRDDVEGLRDQLLEGLADCRRELRTELDRHLWREHPGPVPHPREPS